MKLFATWLLLLASVIGLNAQTLNIQPSMTPAGGNHDDNIDVTCTFPEGCAGGKYWFNGAQIQAKNYTGPIHLEHSTKLSIAGINSEGRIITDVVTYDFNINKVTKPFITADPEENTVRESFYVTKIIWNNASSTDLDLSAFKEGGSRRGEKLVWLVYEPTKEIIHSDNTTNVLWKDGTDKYKAYIYKNYRPTAEGAYTIHIASGVFVIDGKPYNEEVVLHYYIGSDKITEPVFSPAPGTYKGKVDVSIEYPEETFWKFYQIGDGEQTVYTGPFTLTETSTVKAWGRTEDFETETNTVTATYTITEPEHKVDILPRPVFSRNGNTITITESDASAMIKVWFNDNMNTARFYTGPFEVTENCKISAVAYRENGLSPTANYKVSDFPVDESNLGTILLRTPEEWESVILTGLSPNSRYVCGYVLSAGTPLSFIWDTNSGKGEFISTSYNNYVTGVSNDGTVCGWRLDVDPITGEISDSELLYGYYHEGTWTRQPAGMTVEGITGDNRLFGSHNGKPAVYDTNTQEMTYYTGTGSIKCANGDGTILAGYVTSQGKKVATYWTSKDKNVNIATDRPCEVAAISGNGNWMYLDNNEWGSYNDLAGYRHNVSTGATETIVSMGAQYPSRYEWSYSIVNDGTLYGVYDLSLLSHNQGQGLTYGTDGIWRNTQEVLTNRGVNLGNVIVTSSKYVSADQDLFILTVFPADESVDDAFIYGMAVRLNTVVKHAAPTGVTAKQMYGIKSVKVEWENPLVGAESVKGYKVIRNGELLGETNASTHSYYDTTVEDGVEYSYTVAAVYNDGAVSEESYPYTLKVALAKHMPARDLALRQSGINDINLTWQSPIVSLPKLQYFNEKTESAAFGTGNFSSEWGIRIPASDLVIYEGLDIRTFQFLPTGAQRSYEIRLYKGSATDADYDAEPFYTQAIDPASLKFGTVNTIELNTPQPLVQGKDLIVGLFIGSAGNDNMLGVSHDGFRAGYTDLCRIEGVHDRFVSIANESSATTEIVNPLGIGLGTTESIDAMMVQGYEISQNGETVGSTSEISFRITDVAEGKHTFAVAAQYKDGTLSEPISLTYTLKKNEAAFVPVEKINIATDGEGKATFTWNAPLNEDRTNIHWGDMKPKAGLPNMHYPTYSAGAIYPVTITNAYAGEYEISHIFYTPTANAEFFITLDNNEEGAPFAEFEIYDAELGKINYIELENPITVDPSTNYRLIIDVWDCPEGVAPLAFDSSNKDQNFYSNMLNVGLGWGTLADVLQIDDRANWLMGLVIRQKNASEMPLDGYNVTIDGTKCNADILTERTFTASDLTEGAHTVAVDVVYDANRTVKGTPSQFVITTAGINGINADGINAPAYDVEGRRVITDKMGRGLFIIGNKKYIKK